MAIGYQHLRNDEVMYVPSELYYLESVGRSRPVHIDSSTFKCNACRYACTAACVTIGASRPCRADAAASTAMAWTGHRSDCENRQVLGNCLPSKTLEYFSSNTLALSANVIFLVPISFH